MKFFTRDGWTFEQHDRNLNLFEIPSITIVENDLIYVQRVNIAHSQGLSRVVYFVSGKNGDEFGQFKTEIEALEKFNSLKKETN